MAGQKLFLVPVKGGEGRGDSWDKKTDGTRRTAALHLQESRAQRPATVIQEVGSFAINCLLAWLEYQLGMLYIGKLDFMCTIFVGKELHKSYLLAPSRCTSLHLNLHSPVFILCLLLLHFLEIHLNTSLN